jgi:phosphoserine aminotransferase
LQFSAVPLNLLGDKDTADYAVTGNFSSIAAKEAARYCKVNIAASSEDRHHTYIPAQAELKLNPDAAYFYYCSNNTIFGTEWKYVPEVGNVPLVCDMSSNILTHGGCLRYGVIFAGAQKNMGRPD